MWDEHIRLFIRPVYFQPSGFMVIGKALPSRSFPEGVNISPSPSFLPLCLFFSNSIFSPKHHSPLSTHRQGMLEGIWEKQNTHTHTHTYIDKSVRLQKPTVIPEKLLLLRTSPDLSRFPIAALCCLQMHLYLSPFTALVGLSRPTVAFLRRWCLLMTFNDDLLWLIKPGSVTGNINFNYSVVRSW